MQMAQDNIDRKFRLVWIPAHTSILGNEIAFDIDRLF